MFNLKKWRDRDIYIAALIILVLNFAFSNQAGVYLAGLFWLLLVGIRALLGGYKDDAQK